MQNNQDLNPIYIIKDYVWKLLQQELDMQEIDGMEPITTSDNPEFREGDSPYIVYSFNEEFSPDIRARHVYNAAFGVYSRTVKEGADIIGLLSSALNDENSANNILTWSNHPSNPNRSTYAGINLGYIHVVGSESPAASADEGGILSGYIIFRYSFTSQDKDYSIIP